jgi:hypothetical protein
MVKLDDQPFGAGAMRECFAMKKLSQHTTQRDWKRAQNLVAKRYMKPQHPDVSLSCRLPPPLLIPLCASLLATFVMVEPARRADDRPSKSDRMYRKLVKKRGVEVGAVVKLPNLSANGFSCDSLGSACMCELSG